MKRTVVYKPGQRSGVCEIGRGLQSRFNEKYWTGAFTPAGKPQQTSLVRHAALFEDNNHAYNVAGKFKALSRWKVGEREEETIQ